MTPMERADRAIDDALAEANTTGDVIRLRYWFARHVEQAEAEARAATIEDAAQWHDDIKQHYEEYGEKHSDNDGDRALGKAVFHERCASHFRALAKPSG